MVKAKVLYLFFAIIFFVNIGYSNDSGIIAVGGTWVVMKGEHQSVQMQREKIEINVYEKYYDVIAEFIFVNNGDACDVYMGFPESGYGDIGGYIKDSTGFLMFSTSVNGVTVDAKREIVKSEYDYGDEYKAYWIKSVSFKEGETKKVVVKYRSPLGIGISAYYNGTDEFISYVFSGGNWFGKVEESKVNIYFHVPAEVRLKDTPVVKELDHYTYSRTNWEAEEYLRLNFKIKKEDEQ